MKDPVLTRDVDEVAKSFYNIGEEFFNAEHKKQLMIDMKAQVESEVYGLEEIKERLFRLTYRTYGGIRTKGKPHRRVLFAGPPGTGKTHFAMSYARGLGAVEPVRILCSQFAERSDGISDLMSEISKAVRRNPLEVIILDEIEKMPKHVQESLLGLLDSGEFIYTQKGKTKMIKATNAAFILLTNAGDGYIDQFRENRDQFNLAELKRQMIADQLSRPLVDRLLVEVFFPPTAEEAVLIVEAKIEQFIKEAKAEYGISNLTLNNKNELVARTMERIEREGISIRDAEKGLEDYIKGSVAESAIFDPESCENLALGSL